jgi:hypothetical protein
VNRRTDAAFEAWVDRARSLPIEAGLPSPMHWKKVGPIEKIGPCPRCGGDDRFSINGAKGLWCCRRGRDDGSNIDGKDAISLVMHLEGCNFLEAVERLNGGPQPGSWETAPRSPTQRADPDAAARNLESARLIVNRVVPVRGTAGERYLAKVRQIDTDAIADVLERTDAIGWHPAVYFNEPGNSQYGIPAHPLHGRRLGAIIGVMTDPVTGRPTGAISRTYLGPDGMKVGKAKTLGRPQGPVRLTRDEDVAESLHLSEGLETALTGMAVGFRPMWSTGSTWVMATFPMLSGIARLTVIADHDAIGAGEAAAQEVASRWQAAGRQVRILRPRAMGDLNDVVRRRSA